MKNLLLFSAIVALFACNGNKSDETAADSTAVNAIQPPEGFVALDLTQYGFPISTFVPQPDSVEGVPEATVEEIGGGAIAVKSGKYFQLKIADGPGDIQQKKTEFSVDDVYSYEYVVDDSSAFLYKRQIKDSPLPPEYHFFFVLKAGNRTIEIENVKEGVDDFPQRAAERMLDVARATQVKNV